MPVDAEITPNPNAMKFTVGADVGGPRTFQVGEDVDDPLANELFAIDGVTNVFMTADFVTLTKTPESSWDAIAPEAMTILERHYPT